MTQRDRNSKPPIHRTPQNTDNWSFDETFKIGVAGMLGLSSDGNSVQYVQFDPQGNILTSSGTNHYHLADIDEAASYNYYGYTDKDENWYIMRENSGATEYRYVKGSGSYATAWSNRASQSYDYFHEVF